jgi:hypothetical protein
LSKEQRTVAHHLVEKKHTLTSVLSGELPLPDDPLKAVELISDQIAHAVTNALPSHRQIELGAALFNTTRKSYSLKQLTLGLPTTTSIPFLGKVDLYTPITQHQTHFHPDYKYGKPCYGLSIKDIAYAKKSNASLSSVNSQYAMVTFEPQSDATTPYGGKITTHASRENVVLPKYFRFPEGDNNYVRLKTADYLDPDSWKRGVFVAPLTKNEFNHISWKATEFTIKTSLTINALAWGFIGYNYVRKKIENSK